MIEPTLQAFHQRLRRRRDLRTLILALCIGVASGALLAMLLVVSSLPMPWLAGAAASFLSALLAWRRMREAPPTLTQAEALAESLLATQGALGAAAKSSPFQPVLGASVERGLPQLGRVELSPLFGPRHLLAAALALMIAVAAAFVGLHARPALSEVTTDQAVAQQPAKNEASPPSAVFTLATQLAELRQALLADQAKPSSDQSTMPTDAERALAVASTASQAAGADASVLSEDQFQEMLAELEAAGLLDQAVRETLADPTTKLSLPRKQALIQQHLSEFLDLFRPPEVTSAEDQPQLLSRRHLASEASKDGAPATAQHPASSATSPTFEPLALQTSQPSPRAAAGRLGQNYLQALNRAMKDE